MPAKRIEMRKIRDIMRLHAEGMSHRSIGLVVGVSPATVGDLLGRVVAAGLTWPFTARTFGAGVGFLCGNKEIGTSRCGYGDFRKCGVMFTCNYLSEAESLYPAEAIPPEVASGRCDYVFESCTYWYSSESCPTQENCSHPTACESGTDEYGDPTSVCSGACIYDSRQDKDRCATTCQDLFDFYQD